jgi:CHAT domain-containing protein/tetratricopeptide (TPR) repeat protein
VVSAALLVALCSSTTISQSSQRGAGKKEKAERFSVLAEKAAEEGDRLHKEWKRKSLQLAAKQYAEAHSFWQSNNNSRREADILKRLGDVYSILSNYPRAIDYYSRALLLASASSDKQLEVDILYQLSIAYLDRANVNKALPYCQKVQEISRQIGYQKGWVKGLNCVGVVSSISSDVLKALESFDQALAIWPAERADDIAADTLLNLGYLHSNLGNMELSLNCYKSALAVWQTINNQQKQAFTLTAMAGVYALQGEKQTALNFHNQALKLFQTMGNRNGEAATLNGIGYFYDALGDRTEALRRYERALELFRSIDNQHYAAITLGYKGRVYFALGETDKALDFYNQKLATSRSVQDPRMESYTLSDIGNVLNSISERDKALDYYQHALTLSREVLDRRGSAFILNSIGSLYEELKNKPESLKYYEQALPLMQAVADRRGEVLTLYRIARVQRDLGSISEARATIERSIDVIERLRTKVTSPSLRISYLETVYQHYEFYIDLLMRMHRQNPTAGYEVLALETLEHARAKTLLESLIGAGADIREGVNPELLAEETKLRQRLSQKAEQLTRLLSGRSTPQQATVLKKEVEILLTQYREVESRVRDKSPKYAALTQPSHLKFSDIQNELDKETVLLEYSLGTERSYCWVVTPTSITSYELPGRAQIETEATEFYRLLSTSNARQNGEHRIAHKDRVARNLTAYTKVSARLSTILLDPIASHLGQKRLVIVADGILQYIPFVSLPEPGQEKLDGELREPLVVNHEVITLPSLSALAVLRREMRGRPPAKKTVAVFADPVFERDDPRVLARRKIPVAPSFGQNYDERLASRQLERAASDLEGDNEATTFQRLPFSFQEAQAILEVVPNHQTLLALGLDANLKTALHPQLREYRVVHFATHGLLNNSYPELSGIVLSLVDASGNPQDGFLRLTEIYNLNLPAELVVLSACQTALGKEARGEGLIGLTRGFMYAGVARVVASLWRINDRSAAELMRYFYEAMFRQKLAPAAALRSAQIRMWRTAEWRFPHHWAAFVLQGEWN